MGASCLECSGKTLLLLRTGVLMLKASLMSVEMDEAMVARALPKLSSSSMKRCMWMEMMFESNNQLLKC